MARAAATDVVPADDPAAGNAIKIRDRNEVMQAFDALLALVPDAVDDDGFGIMADLIEAENWEGLNRDAKLPSADDLAPFETQILSLSKRPADMGQDISHYLVVESRNTSTNKTLRWQTSSPGVVVPLVKLNAWGKLPAVVQINKSERPTKAGFFPLNLTVLAVH